MTIWTRFLTILLISFTSSYAICEEEAKNGISLEPSIYSPEDGSNIGIGFKYDWKYTKKNENKTWNFQFSSTGNVMLNSVRHEDLLEHGVKWAYTDFNISSSPSYLQPFSYVDAGFHYTAETDQEFKESQHAYGVNFAGAFNINSDNMFFPLYAIELIPAIIRHLTLEQASDDQCLPDPNDASKCLTVKKTTFWKQLHDTSGGGIVASLEQVYPKDNDTRQAVYPGTEKFDRLYAHFYWSTPLFHVKAFNVTAPLVLQFTYRYWKELDAPMEIKNANLDTAKYATWRLKHSGSDFHIDYATGKLPFGFENEHLVKIGWSYNIP